MTTRMVEAYKAVQPADTIGGILDQADSWITRRKP